MAMETSRSDISETQRDPAVPSAPGVMNCLGLMGIALTKALPGSRHEVCKWRSWEKRLAGRKGRDSCWIVFFGKHLQEPPHISWLKVIWFPIDFPLNQSCWIFRPLVSLGEANILLDFRDISRCFKLNCMYKFATLPHVLHGNKSHQSSLKVLAWHWKSLGQCVISSLKTRIGFWILVLRPS